MGQQPPTNRNMSSPRLLVFLIILALFVIDNSKILGDNSWLTNFLGFVIGLVAWLFPLQPTSLRLLRSERKTSHDASLKPSLAPPQNERTSSSAFRSEPRTTQQKGYLLLAAIYTLQAALYILLLWYVYANPVSSIDIAITREFQKSQSPWLQVPMLAVSYLGNQPILFSALIALTAVVFWVTWQRLEALLILSLSAIAPLLILLSRLPLPVNHPRPTARLIEVIQQTASGPGFPSGYVVEYIVFWGLLFSLILFKRDRWWHYALLIISALFVILVGPSRIYLGDYWATDVLGGYMFGVLLVGIGLWMYFGLKIRGVLTAVLPDVPQLLPCGHERRSATARFCSVCGAPISS